MNKDIVFFSLSCKYSREVLKIIKDKNLDNHFIFINIEDDNIELPSFLEVVPTIYIQDEQTLVIDEEIITLINNKKTKLESSAKNEVMGYMNDTFSVNFSNLNNEELNNSTDHFSNINENLVIKTSDDNPQVNRSLDNYQSQRQKDINEIFSR